MTSIYGTCNPARIPGFEPEKEYATIRRMDYSRQRLKPWQRLGITKKQYLASKPWKGSGLSREKYEYIISVVPQEALNELRIEAKAEALLERVFGENL